MTIEELMDFYEGKVSMSGLIYYQIPLWKRRLQNVVLFSVIGFLGWPSLELLLVLDQPQTFWIKCVKFLAVVIVGGIMARLAIHLHARHFAEQVKRTPKLNQFYINRTKVDWRGFKNWQQKRMRKKLLKSGYATKSDIEFLYQHLSERMKRERFWFVSSAALFAAVGLPVWSAFLASIFDKHVTTLGGRMLLLFFLSILAVIFCWVLRMSSEIYSTSFSKYSRVSLLRALVGDLLINNNLRKQNA